MFKKCLSYSNLLKFNQKILCNLFFRTNFDFKRFVNSWVSPCTWPGNPSHLAYHWTALSNFQSSSCYHWPNRSESTDRNSLQIYDLPTWTPLHSNSCSKSRNKSDSCSTFAQLCKLYRDQEISQGLAWDSTAEFSLKSSLTSARILTTYKWSPFDCNLHTWSLLGFILTRFLIRCFHHRLRLHILHRLNRHLSFTFCRFFVTGWTCWLL